MTTDLLINGSQGEGGGQIVRSSLALAPVTGKSVTIENILAGREKPRLNATASDRRAGGNGCMRRHRQRSGNRFAVPHFLSRGRFVLGSINSAWAPLGEFATLVLQTCFRRYGSPTDRHSLFWKGARTTIGAPVRFLQKAFPAANQPHGSARLSHARTPRLLSRRRRTLHRRDRTLPSLSGFDLLRPRPTISRAAFAFRRQPAQSHCRS